MKIRSGFVSNSSSSSFFISLTSFQHRLDYKDIILALEKPIEWFEAHRMEDRMWQYIPHEKESYLQLDCSDLKKRMTEWHIIKTHDEHNHEVIQGETSMNNFPLLFYYALIWDYYQLPVMFFPTEIDHTDH